MISLNSLCELLQQRWLTSNVRTKAKLQRRVWSTGMCCNALETWVKCDLLYLKAVNDSKRNKREVKDRKNLKGIENTGGRS